MLICVHYFHLRGILSTLELQTSGNNKFISIYLIYIYINNQCSQSAGAGSVWKMINALTVIIKCCHKQYQLKQHTLMLCWQHLSLVQVTHRRNQDQRRSKIRALMKAFTTLSIIFVIFTRRRAHSYRTANTDHFKWLTRYLITMKVDSL